jgi:uncharacterized membrane protein
MEAFVLVPVAHAYQGGPAGFWFGGFMMFLLWIVIIFFIVRFFIRGNHPWRGEAASMDRAGDVLAERYARGEIEAEEFQARSQTLRDLRRQEPSPVTRARGMFAARSAYTILAERYARGEIDADEYRERTRNLEA